MIKPLTTLALTGVCLGGCTYKSIDYAEMWEKHLDNSKALHATMEGVETEIIKEGWKETIGQVRRKADAYFSRSEQGEKLLYLIVTDGNNRQIEEIAVRNKRGIEIFTDPATREIKTLKYENGNCQDEGGCIYGMFLINWLDRNDPLVVFPDWKPDGCYSPIGRQPERTWEKKELGKGGREDVVAFTYLGLLDFRETHQWFVTANGERSGRLQTNRNHEVRVIDKIPDEIEDRARYLLRQSEVFDMDVFPYGRSFFQKN